MPSEIWYSILPVNEAAQLLDPTNPKRHDVLAERGATLGDLRRELAGGSPGAALSLDAWIDGALGAAGASGAP